MKGRIFLAMKAAAGLAVFAPVLSACGTATNVGVAAPSAFIYVFNKGNNTISVIDPADNQVKVIQTVKFPAYGLYPSNQYGLGSGYLMLPEATQVAILKDSNLSAAATIPMTSAKGLWTAILPDGKTGIVVARATDAISWVNMDPTSKAFGTIEKTVTVPGKVGLCDISLSPNGQYAYIPDLYTSQLQVVNTTTGNTVYLGPSPIAKSFMGTVSWNGKIWAIEGSSGSGSVEYMSLANPIQPKLIKVLTQANDLGVGPHTDEFSPNNQYDFVLDRTSSQVSVVSMKTFQVVHTVQLPAGGLPRVAAFSYTGSTLYVSLEGINSVAAINTSTFAVDKIIKVGPDPVGLAPTLYQWAQNGG